ncbi:TPA: hypothetical protein HA265_05905 [Candidatus Woesearchaeota archaeon]|nr:hypothetical protein [Candidatus Woesearchaeota archaeon]
MFVKLMGFADLLAAAVVLLLHYDIFVGWRIGLVFSMYLIIKGWIFRTDFTSFIDIICGIYLFIMIFGLTTIVSWAVAIYLFQKAVFSIAA